MIFGKRIFENIVLISFFFVVLVRLGTFLVFFFLFLVRFLVLCKVFCILEVEVWYLGSGIREFSGRARRVGSVFGFLDLLVEGVGVLGEFLA